MASRLWAFTPLLLLSLFSNTSAHPGTRNHDLKHAQLFARQPDPVCRAPIEPDDYAAKSQAHLDAPICTIDRNNFNDLITRQSVSTQPDDYSCSESKPCSNGACCSKKTGYCNYGPDACGPDLGSNPSPNDVCWSNCDALAECGKYALPAGKTCPLNVCCSEYGFCGMTSDFCDDTCQSDCDQPGSGGSGGDVQSRVIGYYEAWAHDRSCQSMDFKDIPAGALTHLHFSFGYVTPGDFEIAPMDDLQESLFRDLTDVKSRNSGLKTVVALGGWTFNDNGTASQPVFSDICSSQANRAKFIGNLLAFLRQYAFDGVDFDWEYPGAPDRGGHPDDGKNFVSLLSELQDAIKSQPIQYTVSFTAPTSYWYLRWFDLTAVNHVDWINLMAYDLHGIWDSTDPIGSHILAHTNLTEIKQALDLFWRNDVPAGKINLGVGFYGRSFQLSDPSCYTPGCNFKGGASPGACTQNSGTLSYREIADIIKQNDIVPIHDEVDAVKYITWNQDQWVSYDDGDTFKAKIDYANSVGLGGLLIWSIDQDTDDLEALSALLAPKDLTQFKKEADNANYWADATAADCYVTDCGGSCNSGFIPITTQPCGGAKPVTRHSTEKDSTLCCPITAAPDPKHCTWRGSAPSCNGHCQDNEVLLELNRWGSGKYCEDGNKAYCCEAADHDNKCYWTGVGGDCNSGDTTFTFAGTFLETIVDIIDVFPPSLIGSALDSALSDLDMDLRRKYCCPDPDAQRWKNCQWYGEPGSCFDNHCPAGHSVQLTESSYGLGESCFPRLERQRVYCCDAADGAPPFSPVPLDYLFPSPPTGDNVDIDTTLKVDNTWGTGSAKSGDDEPNDATFGFVVLASPEEIQFSLDKRDGSDWEVFNCNDAVSEEEQTIQIYCGNENTTNCDRIHLGYGVPGTILEMPDGCGPSRYAVAKDMVPSETQDFPHHLEKRTYAHKPTIYDLTFDFEWKRVPRDIGETQMRIDYSNMEGYWDSIVDKAADKKRKRSLDEYGGNHKRWLEDEWRDDMHFGGLSREDLHKRWFGEDVLSWLKGLFNPSIKQEITHDFSQTFTAKLLEEDWSCEFNGVQTEAHLLIQALMDVKVSTSFGITIIATLGPPISLKDSYLYFKNEGQAEAIFSLDALGKVKFGPKEFELLNLANFPGATFSVPKLVTVGPNFRLLGTVDAEVTLAAHLESRAKIASWNVQQTYPPANNDYMPKDLSPVDVDGTGSFQGLSAPTFDYSVKATGQVSAHIKPTIEFGIHFDPYWQISNAAVQLIADGSVTLKAEISNENSQCPFTYGVDVGARLYVHVDAPSFNGWTIPDFDLYPLVTKSPIQGGSCPSKRDLEDLWYSDNYNASASGLITRDRITIGEVAMDPLFAMTSSLEKRGGTYGPPFHVPRTGCLFCPSTDDSSDSKDCSKVTGWEPSQLAASANNDWQLKKRDLLDDDQSFGPSNSSDHFNLFDKRASTKTQQFCKGAAVITIESPPFDSSGDIVKPLPNIPSYGYAQPSVCNNFDFGTLSAPPSNTADYATEHILEFQLIQHFFNELASTKGTIYDDPYGGASKVDLCRYLKPYWYQLPTASNPTVNGITNKPIQILSYAFPSNTQYTDEWVLLDAGVNTAKEGMWGSHEINSDSTMNTYEQSDPDKLVRNIKDVLSAWKYHQDSNIQSILKKQRNRVSDTLDAIETAITGLQYAGTRSSKAVQPYTAIGLKASWEAWSSARITKAKSKADTYMTSWLNSITDGYATEHQREVAKELAAQGETDPQTLIDKIDALTNAVAAKPAWSSPF